jgi:RNA polymerase sigma-70 factor, ECF subfamily
MNIDSQAAKLAGPGTNVSGEAELVARIIGGERELFHELVRPCSRMVYRMALSILRNKEEAEDVAQETMVKALEGLHKFRAESKFSTWLIAIALNEARSRIRQRRRYGLEYVDHSAAEDSGDLLPADIPDKRGIPLAVLEQKELGQALESAIARLPETYREVLLLRKVEELSIAKTAGTLGVSKSLVKIRLLRARLMMQKMLVPQLDTCLTRGAEPRASAFSLS